MANEEFKMRFNSDPVRLIADDVDAEMALEFVNTWLHKHAIMKSHCLEKGYCLLINNKKLCITGRHLQFPLPGRKGDAFNGFTNFAGHRNGLLKAQKKLLTRVLF
jgi:hypothetical protein